MLTASRIENSTIVAATYDGGMTATEMESVRDQLRAVIAESGHVRLLIEYVSIDWSQIEPKAIWEDLRTAGLMPKVERLALVTDKHWMETISAAVGAVVGMTSRQFAPGERAAALAWLREP